MRLARYCSTCLGFNSVYFNSSRLPPFAATVTDIQMFNVCFFNANEVLFRSRHWSFRFNSIVPITFSHSYVNFTLHGMPLHPRQGPTCTGRGDTSWWVAWTLRAISVLLCTAITVITNKIGPRYSTGQPDPHGARIPELLWVCTQRYWGCPVEFLEPRRWPWGGREGWLGPGPVFHGDNNIYHHGGGKEGDRRVRQK